MPSLCTRCLRRARRTCLWRYCLVLPDALARAPQLSPGCALPPALKQFCWRVCRQLKQLDSIPNDYKPSQLAQVRHSILAAERRNVVGYLRKGDSLSGMGVKWARRDRADVGRHMHVSEDTPGAAAALTRLSFSACRLRTPHQSSELLAEGPQ